jgi:hypothetical protein
VRWPAGALALIFLATGCAQTVTGAAVPVMTALRVLPTESEIATPAGNALSTFGFQPFIGGVEILPDGYRTETDASPIGCIAVTDTAPRVVYEPQPVADVARQSYFNWDEGVASSGADAAAVQLATADAAQQAFAAFVRQWQRCDGATVVKHLRGTGGDSVIDAKVSDVKTEGSLLSAIVRTRQRPKSPASTYERALGVRNQTIVEVSLAITPAGERQSGPRDEAVRVARVMLDKAGRAG